MECRRLFGNHGALASSRSKQSCPAQCLRALPPGRTASEASGPRGGGGGARPGGAATGGFRRGGARKGLIVFPLAPRHVGTGAGNVVFGLVERLLRLKALGCKRTGSGELGLHVVEAGA